MSNARNATPPDVTLPRDAVIALMKAADVVRREMVRVLQPFNLTLPQFNVLIILKREPELPTLEVAARLVEQTPGITRLMNTLAAKGYLRRRRCRNDRRQQLCSLTKAGTQLIDAVIPEVKAAQEDIINGLGRDELSKMIAALHRLRPARSQDAPASHRG